MTERLDTPQGSAIQRGKPAGETGHEHPAAIRSSGRPLAPRFPSTRMRKKNVRNMERDKKSWR
jgi:hypothetical protein